MGTATTATVMFTDLAGSTALSVRLGAARAERMFQDHFALVRGVLDAHGGTAVKTLGDGVMAVFDSIGDGVDCAVALQQAVEAANRGNPDGLELRVGMSVGEVTVDYDDYFGTAVVEASRLCSHAKPGQILASSFVGRLAGSRCTHVFRPAGVRELKGLPDPLEVDDVAWLPLIGRGVQADFRHLDELAEVDTIVDFLEYMRDTTLIREVRQRILQLLLPELGHRLLDVGSGVGSDVIELAQLVGESGIAVGVDKSESMVDVALARSAGIKNADFKVGDAQLLPFDDGEFDGCRSDRTFQYLPEPLRAVREMARVTRQGGRVVVADTDWETAVLDTPDPDLSRRIHQAWTESRPSGRVGHQLYGLFHRAGLSDVRVFPHTQVVTDYSDPIMTRTLPALAAQGVDSGVATPEETSRWLAGIAAAGEQGRFFRSFTMFVVSGVVAE